MKINNMNPSAAINSYLNTGSSSKTVASGKEKKDTVAIDGRNFNPKTYASTVASEISGDVSAERLAALKQSIEDGSYNVPADILADALLGKI